MVKEQNLKLAFYILKLKVASHKTVVVYSLVVWHCIENVGQLRPSPPPLQLIKNKSILIIVSI